MKSTGHWCQESPKGLTAQRDLCLPLGVTSSVGQPEGSMPKRTNNVEINRSGSVMVSTAGQPRPSRISELEPLPPRTQSPSGSPLVRHFLRSAGAVLLLTGCAKLWSCLGTASILHQQDPLLGIPFRHLFLLVGTVEVGIGAFCFLKSKHAVSAALVAWLALSFLIYRCGLWLMGWHQPCGCLGTLTQTIHVSPQLADNFMKALVIYMLLGSVFSFVLLPRRSS